MTIEKALVLLVYRRAFAGALTLAWPLLSVASRLAF